MRALALAALLLLGGCDAKVERKLLEEQGATTMETLEPPECLRCTSTPVNCDDIATVFGSSVSGDSTLTAGCAAGCTSAEDITTLATMLGDLAECEGFPTASVDPPKDDSSDEMKDGEVAEWEDDSSDSENDAVLPISTSPTGTPTEGPKVTAVKAVVTFADLAIDEFNNATFDASFRTAYKAQVAAAAMVETSAVVIDSIIPGSVQVVSTVFYPTDNLTRADDFVNQLTTDATSVFTEATFKTYGDVTTEAQAVSVLLSEAVDAGAVAILTASPTAIDELNVTAPTMSAAITTAPAAVLALMALVVALLF